MRAVQLATISVALLAAFAASETTVNYRPGLRLHPISDIPQQNYTTMNGATVSIEEGYAAGDQLMLDYAGEFDIKSNFDVRTGTLFISGFATVSEYARAIQDVVFTTTSELGGSRRVTWSFGENTLYSTRTRHFYKFINEVGASWATSLERCNLTTWMGMQGYLATVTSAVEMDALSRKAWMSAWIAAKKDAQTQWTWQAGPEKSWPAFWSGKNMYRGGAPVNGGYSAWGRFQPTDATGANYAAIQPSEFDAYSSWYSYANSDGVQGLICEFGGMDSPAVAAMASNYAGTVLMQFGCANFTTQSECNNQRELGCKWSGSCVQSTCTVHATQFECQKHASCDWNMDGKLGFCVDTACESFDAPTCGNSSACIMPTGETVCRPRTCADQTTACGCRGLSATCKWSSGKCYDVRSAKCSGMDVVYMIDGTAAMGQRFGLASSGYVGLITYLKEADQYLSGSGSGAVPPADGMRVGYVAFGAAGYQGIATAGTDVTDGMLTGLRRQKLADLEDLGKTFAKSPTRYLQDAATISQTMFAQGQYASQRQKVVVIFAAGPIADAASVASTLSSMNGVTFYGVALRPTPTQTDDSMAAMKDLQTALPAGSPIVSLTLSEVSSQAIFGLCNPQDTFGKVALQGKTTMPLCSDRTTMATCTSDAFGDEFCSWSYSANACVPSHCGALCNSACGNDATCKWNTDVCTKKCFGTAASCPSGCQTVGNACVPAKCNGNPTEDACIADPEKCAFNSTADTPCQPVTCPSFSTETTCPSSCTWVNSQCMEDPCKTRGKPNCLGLAQCAWGTPAGASEASCYLEPVCGTRLTETLCGASELCAWNTTVGPAACTLAPCTGLNVETNKAVLAADCRADSRCMFLPNQDNGYCKVKECSMHGSAMACSSDDSCVWRNNTCKDARYAQCPAIDLFFLVEGTQAMRQDFGRHPSGFMGVMEAVREWSRDAPWAADATSAGYRMAIGVYGAPNKALLVPPVSSGTPENERSPAGNGKYFISDAARFESYNGAVSYLEGEVASYSAVTGSDNYLYKGLEAAKASFAAGDPNRKRVLVILGSSPFQDGSNPQTVVGTMINELEGMGVNIFSNIIRRFSTITPVEQQAEEFMRPLASDPASTHFLYTSIENLRPLLLDKFCDPTTSAGQALGVSRDNTLPCSWLEQGECSLQRNCVYNSTAVRTCPLPTQCPNLECQELPASLQGSFTCPQCTLVSGKVTCSAQPKAAQKGLCVPNSCALNYATEAACNGAAGCAWSTERQRCDSNPCPGLTTGASCNANLGCYWMQASSTCAPSSSWRYRSQASCLAVTTTYGSGASQAVDKANFWMSTAVPAVCVPRRCPYLTTQTDCNGALGQAQGCTYKSSNTPQCARKPCPYMTSLACAADAGCYWNPYDSMAGSCEPVPSDGSCALSKFSNYSQCTATCGAAIQYRSRRILSFRDVSKNPAAKTCETVANAMSQQATGTKLGIVDSRSCTVPSDCTSHCSAYTSNNDRVGCARDISCRWRNGCEPIALRNCAELTSESACNGFADACTWNAITKFCVPALTRCTSFQTAGDCGSVASSLSCQWNDGTSANTLANSIGAPVQLVNPGPQQKPIFVFPDLAVSSDEVIDGATVAIEKHYQRNKDKLALLYPSALTATWSPAAGTLTLSGSGTVGDYVNAIRYVTFQTTSASQSARVITWSLRSNTAYSGMTGKVFRYFASAGITWDAASAACRGTSYWGKRGYLAVLNNADDNNVVAAKLWAQGWIGASDAAPDKWMWTTGPFATSQSTFWQGPAALVGGATVGSSYANWNAVTYQPTTFSSQGVNHAYIGLSGTWEAHNGLWSEAQGYVCEYGGLESDTASAFNTTGVTVVGSAGCVPQACVWRNTSTCNMDSECSLSERCVTKDSTGACTETAQQCVPACATLSTPQDCEVDIRCKWDTQSVPAACSWNPCNLPRDSCIQASNCTWDPQLKCRFKTGCAAIEDAATCTLAAACSWQAGTCVKKQCSNIANPTVCMQNPSCTYNAETNLCTDAACRSGDETTCTADSRCQWIDQSSFAVGFQVGGAPVKPFAQSLPPGQLGSNYVDGVTVMITQGFRRNQDRLDVSSTFLATQGWTRTYDATTGTLFVATGSTTSVTAQTVYAMLRDQVTFTTNSKSDTQREVVFAYGLNTFKSAAANSYMTYVPSQTPVSFADAKSACEGRSYFGVNGRMAAVATEADALNLARFKPNGWIGATADSSNAWTWIATGARFWQLGMGSFGPVENNGVTVYANWAASQPLIAKGTDRFWAVATPTGMWRSEAKQSMGYVCEFVAPQAVAGMGRAVRPEGCFQRPCLSLTRIQCASQSNCRWFAAEERCGLDSFCSSQTTASTCGKRAGCYWNYDTAMCATAAPDTCSDLTATRCNNTAEFPTCKWDSYLLTPTGTGACVKTDCVGYSVAECQSRPQCYVDAAQQQCLGRVCGFVDRVKCFKDRDCEWVGSSCQIAACARHTSVLDCNNDPACQMSNITATCERKACRPTTNATLCQQNPECVFTNGVCQAPGCATLSGATQCNANPECFYYQNNDAGDQCVTRRCNANLATKDACTNPTQNGAANCRWVDGGCQMNPAPGQGDVINNCEKEIAPNLWWLWALCVVILLLIVAIVYRLYLAYAKGLSFFEPLKNTRSFSPHMNYKDLAFEEAKNTAEETNVGYQNPRVDDNKPSINDL